jgi:hypothetical protein
VPWQTIIRDLSTTDDTQSADSSDHHPTADESTGRVDR